MFLVPGEGEEPHAGLKPMNCPGHMLLFGSQLRSYRDLPVRYAESSTLHRNELAGALHGLLRVRHVTQDDAHIFCTEDQVAQEIDGCIEFAKDLYAALRRHSARRALDPPRQQARKRRGMGLHAKASCRRHSSGTACEFEIGEGEGTFYGPKIDLYMEDALGRSWQMGTIQLDAQMPARFELTYMGADNHEHTPVVSTGRCSARSSASSASSRSTTAAPSRSGSRRCRSGCSPSATTTAMLPWRCRRSWSPPASAPTSTIARRPSAGGSATRSSRRCRTSSSGATASRTTPLAVRKRGEGQSTMSLEALLAEFAELVAPARG